jgi:hypothetical protein
MMVGKSRWTVLVLLLVVVALTACSYAQTGIELHVQQRFVFCID